MDFMECVQGRRSVRKFTAQPVARPMLEQLVRTASFAPSWKNAQTTRYIVVQNADIKQKLATECVMDYDGNKSIIQNAPAVILVTTVDSRAGYERDGSFSTSKGTHWQSFDAGIATQTLCLAAWNEGLGTVIMGVVDEAQVRKTVAIPEGQSLSAMVAIGYPDETPAMPKRKEVADLLTIVE